MKRILCTGASGFLGQNLIKKIDDPKTEIVKLDINPKTFTTLKMDVASPVFSEYFSQQEKFDVIYHFGSPCSIIQFNQDPTYCTRNTLKGFHRTLQLAEKWDAKLIYPSSGNVYGKASLPHTENKIPKPTNLYGKCKYQTETIAEKSVIDTIGLRIYAGYGPSEEQKGNVASVIHHFLKEMLKNQPPVIWGDGTQARDFIYVDDIVNALIKSKSLRGSHIINVGNGQSHSFNEVISIINKILETDLDPKYIEKPKNYVEKTLSDMNYMKKILGLNPMSLESGVTKFSEYLVKLEKKRAYIY